MNTSTSQGGNQSLLACFYASRAIPTCVKFLLANTLLAIYGVAYLHFFSTCVFQNTSRTVIFTQVERK